MIEIVLAVIEGFSEPDLKEIALIKVAKSADVPVPVIDTVTFG